MRPADTSDQHTAEAMPRGNNEHVLLVEDDDQVRSAVLAQLLSLRYLVTEAANGQAALSCLAGGQKFDVVLTDVIMPGIDGRTLPLAWPNIIPA